jgi:selenide,water dikinase
MLEPLTIPEIRLTSLSHGGGCGCKIAPAVLNDILAKAPRHVTCPQLLVGIESSDDAAVYQLNEEQAIVATTDFFMPIVDDPYDFGRIAATNALSDIYAMGARPLLALAIVGMPLAKLPVSAIQEILRGGADACGLAGIPVAGGHSIDAVEPIYGLAVLGIAHPRRVKRNDCARPGDVLILGKGLGIGIMSAALKKGALSAEGYAQMKASTTQLNTVGARLAELPGVHAMTDVTGFGLLGHLAEVCRGSNVDADIDFACLPVLATALQLAQDGFNTGAAARNWASYGRQVVLPAEVAPWQKALLCDPQTSGGLLVSVGPECAAEVLAEFHAAGFGYARAIGELGQTRGSPTIHVRI